MCREKPSYLRLDPHDHVHRCEIFDGAQIAAGYRHDLPVGPPECDENQMGAANTIVGRVEGDPADTRQIDLCQACVAPPSSCDWPSSIRYPETAPTFRWRAASMKRAAISRHEPLFRVNVSAGDWVPSSSRTR